MLESINTSTILLGVTLLVVLFALIVKTHGREERINQDEEEGLEGSCLIKTTTYYQWNRSIPHQDNQKWKERTALLIKKYSAIN
ncbi:unnamed protein product [Rhizopus microsporus]